MCPIPCDESLLNLAAHLAGRPGFDKILCRMVEQTPIGIILVDSEHDVEFANPSAREIMGVVSDELIGKQLSDLFGDDYSQMQLTNTKGLLERIPHEVRFKTKGGKERHIKVEYVGAVEQGSGAYIGFLTDVTDIQQLQTELHRRNTFFHNLIESSVDGIMAADMKGNIILFNSGAQRILGYSKEEAFSQLHTTRLYPEGEARDILRRMRSNDYGGKGLLQRHELIAITKDGRQIPMSISGGIIYDGKEEIATYGIFTDLRGIQKIEADLQQTHKMLLQSEKMAGLGRLAAGVAHEINNPMSGITLYSNLLLERLGEDHPAAEDLHVIINETERCKQIVSDLLEFSHQTTYEHTGVNVNEQIRKALVILRMQPLFHNIEVVTELEGELSRIWGNAIRLNQVFTNIIVNAIQAMEGRGKLTIITRHRSKRGIVEIVITDTGPGIEKEILSEIFDPFFTTKAQDGGTGLGLSVSYAIVREHKGSIRVESTLGKGTSFTLRFPILQEEALEEVS
jgi:PAS domain S-box-containing protein